MERTADNVRLAAASWRRTVAGEVLGHGRPAIAIVLTIVLLASGCASLRRQKVVPESVAACRELSREGVVAMERGESGVARTLLVKAVEASPNDIEARRQLAEVMWQTGSPREAISHMEAAAELDPRHAPTVVRAGEMLLGAGAADQALVRAEEAIAVDATNAAGWALRGRVFRQRGEYERALADLQQALRFDPQLAGAILETAQLQYQLGRPQRCLTTLQHMLEGCPPGEQPRDALWLAGLAYGAVNRPDDAVNNLYAASLRGAPQPELLYDLARAQNAVGRSGEAAETARRALATNGDHAASRALLAQLEGAGVPGVDAPLRR